METVELTLTKLEETPSVPLSTVQASSYLGGVVEKVIEFVDKPLNEVMAEVDVQMPTEKTVIIQNDQLDGQHIARIENRPRGKVLAIRITGMWHEW